MALTTWISVNDLYRMIRKATWLYSLHIIQRAVIDQHLLTCTKGKTLAHAITGVVLDKVQSILLIHVDLH